MDRLEELIEFPTLHTFKIVGKTGDEFTNGVENIFSPFKEKTISSQKSANGAYISYSVTALVESYDILKKLYTEISKLNGIKFYV